MQDCVHIPCTKQLRQIYRSLKHVVVKWYFDKIYSSFRKFYWKKWRLLCYRVCHISNSFGDLFFQDVDQIKKHTTVLVKFFLFQGLPYIILFYFVWFFPDICRGRRGWEKEDWQKETLAQLNLAKLLRSPVLENTSGDCLLMWKFLRVKHCGK